VGDEGEAMATIQVREESDLGRGDGRSGGRWLDSRLFLLEM
jgi:hypothetical protein